MKINCFRQAAFRETKKENQLFSATTVGFAVEIDLGLKDGFSFLINGVEIPGYYRVLDCAYVEIDLKVYTFRQL